MKFIKTDKLEAGMLTARAIYHGRYILHVSSEKPRMAVLGFSMPFLQGGLILRLIAGSIIVVPFAGQVVG